jgi:hypothetical protein
VDFTLFLRPARAHRSLCARRSSASNPCARRVSLARGWGIGESTARGQRDLIVAQEITAANLEGLTAAEVVRRLRPHMLQARADPQLGGTRLARNVVVFINGAEAGGLEVLRTISARTIARIQFMSGVEANNRLQELTQRVGGAILVTLK